MKVTEIEKGRHYLITRESSREDWPTDWVKACGIAAVPGQPLEPTLKFKDGDFIAHTVDVIFTTPRNDQLRAVTAAVETAAGKRDMVVKWANSLPPRMTILKFWEWLAQESPSFRETANGYDIEKLLDRYHGIDRIQLDNERRAMLE
jgi:hypothetical protein